MIMKNRGGRGGEIVQVHGGHILRSTSRKDRHSKVITAKGPRDRRVRLSAHTAIQFYDVQDRLGCDRPSKAVDWLMMKAKNAIDKLSELHPWNPIDDATIADPNEVSPELDQLGRHQSKNSTGYPFQMHRQLGENSSFFPLSSGTQDLCLSLQSVQDSIGSSSHQTHHTPSTDQNQTLFHQGSVPVAFGDDYRRPWNGGENIEGCNFNSLPIPTQQFLCQSSVLSQRGPLQSNFFSSIHAWNEHPIPSTLHQTTQEIQQSSISSTRFASQSLLQFQDQPSSSSPNSHH